MFGYLQAPKRQQSLLQRSARAGDECQRRSDYKTAVVAEEARKVLIGVVVVDARIRVEAASLPLPLAARRR